VQCRRDGPRDLLVFTVRGRVTSRDLNAALTRSLDFGLAEKVVWSLAEGDLAALSLAELEAFIDDAFSGPWAPRRCAIVSGTGPARAAAAVLCALCEARGFAARVEAFFDHGAALEWLGVPEDPSDPAPPASSSFSR